MRRRRISFLIAAFTAILTFVSLSAFVGRPFHRHWGWHHHGWGYYHQWDDRDDERYERRYHDRDDRRERVPSNDSTTLNQRQDVQE